MLKVVPPSVDSCQSSVSPFCPVTLKVIDSPKQIVGSEIVAVPPTVGQGEGVKQEIAISKPSLSTEPSTSKRKVSAPLVAVEVITEGEGKPFPSKVFNKSIAAVELPLNISNSSKPASVLNLIKVIRTKDPTVAGKIVSVPSPAGEPLI